VKKVFLVHGEYETQLNYRFKLLDAGFKYIVIPEKGEIFDLSDSILHSGETATLY
jgi:metallo-beta-lactamase family protein